jgi:amidase
MVESYRSGARYGANFPTITNQLYQLAAGIVTSDELVRRSLDAIDASQSTLNAFRVVLTKEALADAAQADRKRAAGEQLPLLGIPIAVKDDVDVDGVPTRFGTGGYVPMAHQDAEVVRRLRAAGAVIVGKTNTCELGQWPFTSGPAFGHTRNPWSSEHTPGGSSGGSAAAVAGALVPLAHGTDGLGSVRIPAAACGLFGIKPGTGVVPADLGETGWHGLSEHGPLATTVADAALMLGVMAGTSYSLDAPGPLRIAVSVRPPGPGIIVHRSCSAPVRAIADLLGKSGHEVTDADPPYPGWLVPVMLSYWVTGPAGEAVGHASGMEPRTRRHVRAGRLVTRARPPRGSDRARLRAALEPFFERHDVLVMPTLARPCPPARRYGERSWLRSVATALMFAPMTGVWNLAGFPAASVPVPGQGLPGAVQLVAAPGREQTLLALAAEIERASPWRRHAPAYDPAG